MFYISFINKDINVLVVAMHGSQGGQWDTVNKYIGDLDHPCNFALTNILYSTLIVPKYQVNEQGEKDIMDFFLSP